MTKVYEKMRNTLCTCMYETLEICELRNRESMNKDYKSVQDGMNGFYVRKISQKSLGRICN